MEFSFRGPVPNTLRAGIRRLLPALFQHHVLKMPVLQTERISLRPFEPQDLEAIAAWEEIAGAPDPGAAAKEFLDFCFREYRERGIGPWAIQRKDTEVIAGNCGFPEINFKARRGEVNCYIAPGHRRHGLATDALLALFTVGFEQFEFTRIQAICDEDNLNSQGLAEKAGMKFEGYLENAASAKTGTTKKLYWIVKQDFATKSDCTVKVSLKLAARSDSRTEE
jgi:[ribosomal protein S5]-alanine N-acetyltransferase